MALGEKPWPARPGREFDHRALNKLAALVDRSLRGDGGVSVQDYGDRVTISFDAVVPALPSRQNYAQRFVVVEELADTLKCGQFFLPNDGTRPIQQVYDDSLASTDDVFVYVAKPYLLQESPWYGRTIDFEGGTYSVSHPSVGTRRLTGVGATTGTIDQAITPAYLPGEVITAAKCCTGLYATGDDVPVMWEDVNEAGRTWGGSSIQVCVPEDSSAPAYVTDLTVKWYRPAWSGTVLIVYARDVVLRKGAIVKVGCEYVDSRHDVCDCSGSGGDDGGGPILVSCCPGALDTPLCATLADVGGNAPSVDGMIVPMSYDGSLPWFTPAFESMYGFWYGVKRMDCGAFDPPSQDYWIEYYLGCAPSGWYWDSRRVVSSEGGDPPAPLTMPVPKLLTGVVCDPFSATIVGNPGQIQACTDDGSDVATVTATIQACGSSGGGGGGLGVVTLGSGAAAASSKTITGVTVVAGKPLVVAFASRSPSSGSLPAVTFDGHAMFNIPAVSAGMGPISGSYYNLEFFTYTPVAGATGSVVASLTSATDIAIAVVQLNGVTALDKYASDGGGAASTTPDSDDTAVTTAADEVVFGAVLTAGPSGDADGTWLNSMTDLGLDAGTSNLRLCVGSKVVSAINAYKAAKTGITSRQWLAGCVTFKA